MMTGCTQVYYKKMTPQEAYVMMGKVATEVVVLDVRTKEEYDEGHIDEAILIPDNQIESMAPSILLDKNATILVYCRTGKRSAEASKSLIALGYKKVYDFGGILDWPYETVITH
jgi:rhodanese-related sulfurtransferase